MTTPTKRKGLSIDLAVADAVVGGGAAPRRKAPTPRLPPGAKSTRKQDARGNWLRATFVELPEADWALLQAVALHRARPGERPSMKRVVLDLVAAARPGLERELEG